MNMPSWTWLIGVMTPAAPSSWHYAGWIAVDVRLLLFIVFISALTAGGTTALFARGKTRPQIAALYMTSLVVIVALSVLLFNQIATYPVFVVESFFPMP